MSARKNETMTVGALHRGQIRSLLGALKMYGHIDDFTEVKRLLQSQFYIKGANDTAMSNFLQWYQQTNR